jgi:DnaJ-class molecular chaperone
MFCDYYEVLDILGPAATDEIKKAYRKQALKWHPDRNIGIDTSERMRFIVEAYTFLKDDEARSKYDVVYLKFKQSKNSYTIENSTKTGKEFEYNYTYNNEELYKWMQNAREQSFEYLKVALKDFANIATEGGKTFINVLIQRILGFILFSIIISIIVKSCKS